MIKTQDVRRNKFLENALSAVTNNSFIADSILTPKTVVDDTGILAGVGNDHLRVYRSERGLYDRSSHEIDMNYTEEATYKIAYHDLSNYVPDRLKRQFKNPFNPLRDSGLKLLQTLRLRREIDLAAQLTSTSVLTQNVTLSGSDQFNDLANSDPETVIQNAIDTVQGQIGEELNSIIIGRKVLMTLKRHPFFLGLFSGVKVLGQSQIEEALKEFFGFQNVYVGRTIKLTSAQGQAETKGAVWNNDIIVYYKGSGDFDPTLGYSLDLEGYGIRSRVRRHEEDEGDIVKVSQAYQDLPFYTSAGYLIKNAVA